ncbi:MAG: hypothetical protein AB7M05_19260 [Alphaproteobacteria bacterium]
MRGFKAIPIAMALMLASAGSAFPQSAPLAGVLQARSPTELAQKFCAADRNTELVVVLPASMFVDSQELSCDNGIYKLYRIAKADDPDDFVYFLDPPLHSKTVSLGCDGKAGKSMKTVAINCRPCPPLIK